MLDFVYVHTILTSTSICKSIDVVPVYLVETVLYVHHKIHFLLQLSFPTHALHFDWPSGSILVKYIQCVHLSLTRLIDCICSPRDCPAEQSWSIRGFVSLRQAILCSMVSCEWWGGDAFTWTRLVIMLSSHKDTRT